MSGGTALPEVAVTNTDLAEQTPESLISTPESVGISSPSSTLPHAPRHARRAHKKSRTGCATCKTRKIKARNPADPTICTFWRETVVSIGLQCPYIMRTILAISALHLAYHRPALRSHYTTHALLLHQTASRAATALITPGIESLTDAVSLFLFSMLTVYFGTSPFPSRGPGLLATYGHAVDELELALVARGEGPRDVLDAMLWLWEVSDSLVPLLRSDPARGLAPAQEAVAIFAHFCILLKHHESHWWLQGWGDHLISRAYDILDAEHRSWIEWPMREIGWMPPLHIMP
ncbi:hypothetical protein B0T25DRAFT_592322 [Lasiosphaeria hispida]|uniref:Uncharacterized protein n=1 Tax=Lasiosphaeria hispida TaxID=260671 RepID=A0AAJ0MAL1_9PEZI|nr:hypothetical protein B0T25DRAFT_592322 [Lasiosphaeria hispida]